MLNLLIIDYYTFNINYSLTGISIVMSYENRVGSLVEGFGTKNWNIIFLTYNNVSIFFVLLETLCTTFALIITYTTYNSKAVPLFSYLIVIVTIVINATFLTFNIFLFFISFKVVTFIIFLIIYLFRKNILKVKAAFLLLAYSLLNSSLILCYIYISYMFNYDIYDFLYMNPSSLYNVNYYSLLIILFTTLTIKLPLVPFHS